MQELNEEFQREREDLLDSIRALDQQLRLKNLIIEVRCLGLTGSQNVLWLQWVSIYVWAVTAVCINPFL